MLVKKNSPIEGEKPIQFFRFGLLTVNQTFLDFGVVSDQTAKSSALSIQIILENYPDSKPRYAQTIQARD